MEYELCVLCGKTTNVEKNTPIHKRTGYIEGVGQLCRDCYQDFHLSMGATKERDDLINESLLRMTRSDQSKK